ncbi:hypothetical protein [Thiocystis violacea]|nr:hypothetical protein [Thiocystis violacea]
MTIIAMIGVSAYIALRLQAIAWSFSRTFPERGSIPASIFPPIQRIS